MQKRTYGKLGYEVSLLGMGCMRLPRIEKPDGTMDIDRDKAIELIQYAANNGINYFDTAFTYHGGKSEEIIGEALEGVRSQIKIATKQMIWSMDNSKDTMRKNLESTLRKLRTDYLDVYLIHNINADDWKAIKDLDIITEFEKFKAEGLIKSIGFSYHGNFKLFKEVLGSYDWAMCQVQQSLLNSEREVTEEGIKAAGEKGCALVIMEPLRGGGLANVPKDVLSVYDESITKYSPVEWAFRYLIDMPQISNILSGMSTIEQVKDNIEIFSKPDVKPNCLSEQERRVLLDARAAFRDKITVPCTGCEYCMPCPNNVYISGIFADYNESVMFENFDSAKRSYMFTKRSDEDATHCTQCGLCLSKCPQKINITEWLQEAHNKLDGWVE